MSFCPYCGKQLADGEACNCEGAIAERKSNTSSQTNTQAQQATQAMSQTVSQTAEKVSQKVNEAMNSETAAKVQGVLGELKDLVISFFKKPERTLIASYQTPRKSAQYVAGGIYAAVLLIFMWIMLNALDDYAFKLALGITVVWCCMKLILAGATTFRKKDDKKFADVFGVFCVSTIPQTAAFIVFFLLVKIGFLAGAIAMLVVWIAVDILYSVEAMKAVMLETPEKATRLYLIVEAIMVLVIYLIFAQILKSAYNDIIRSLTSLTSFTNFY